MVILRKSVQYYDHHDLIESFLQNKETDCILYSKEGIKFDIHKEILYQTDLMKNLFSSEHSWCCQSIEIFCPCSGNELESFLNFLYNGKIYCNTEKDATIMLGNLTSMFGFPLNLFSVEATSISNQSPEETNTTSKSEYFAPELILSNDPSYDGKAIFFTGSNFVFVKFKFLCIFYLSISSDKIIYAQD